MKKEDEQEKPAAAKDPVGKFMVFVVVPFFILLLMVSAAAEKYQGLPPHCSGFIVVSCEVYDSSGEEMRNRD